jgi:hemolysin III
LYLTMGWIGVIAAAPLWHSLPAGAWLWLGAGGLSYTVGVVFFASKSPFHHAVWHLFVLGGAVSHFFGVLYYVLPT